MPRRACRPRAARTYLARFVVLAALLAGFAVAFGVHCAEMTPSGTNTAATEVVTVADPGHDNGTDGLLMTCLVFLAAVVAAVTGVRPRWRNLSGGAPPSPRLTRSRTLLLRGPRLASLCVSRT